MARRQVVSTKSLLKVEGVAEIVKQLEAIIDQTTGKYLKRVYVRGAALVSDQARANIQNLPISEQVKKVLTATVVTNEGPESKPNAISAVSQRAAERRLSAKQNGIRVPNPFWFEYGTVPRATGTGANRGMMKPTPFFRPAVEAKRAEVKQFLIDELRDILERASAAKAAGKSPRGAFYDRKPPE